MWGMAMKKLSKFILIVTACGFIVSCKAPENPGNDPEVPGTPTPEEIIQSVAGLWIGTTTSSSDFSRKVTSITGVITENNRIKLIEAGVGDQFSGKVISQGSQVVAGMAWFDAVSDGGKKRSDMTLIMNSAVQKESISGTYSSEEDSGEFLLNYNPAYDRPSSLNQISGSWSNKDESIKIDLASGFNGQGLAGCSYTGSVGVINPAVNSYNLNVDVSGCTDDSLSGKYYGVAWMEDAINENDTLKYSIVNSNGSSSLSSQLTRTVVGETPSIAGVWRGTITSNSGKVTSVATGIVAENGLMQLTTSDGDVIAGNMSVDVGNSISAAAKFYKADRSSPFEMTLSGVVTEKSLLEGTYIKTDSSDTAGHFSLVYDAVYENISKQGLVAGNWSEQFESILLNSVGALNGTNTETGCTLLGSIGLLNPNFNAYNVNITTSNCQASALNGAYAGLASLSDESGDGSFDTLIYIINNDTQYLTKIFTKTSNLASITGVWRGTFTNNVGKSVFYKALISEDNEIKFLADTESFPFDQGSDIISGSAIVHTKDSMVASVIEIPANNNPNEILDIILNGVVIEEDSLSGTFEKRDRFNALVEFGNFSFKYDEVYVIPEVNFFVINDTEWNVEKFDNNGSSFFTQSLDLSDSFVLTSDRTTVVTVENYIDKLIPASEVGELSNPYTVILDVALPVAPDDTVETVTTVSTSSSGSEVSKVTIFATTTKVKVTTTRYEADDAGVVGGVATVLETSTTVTTTTTHVDSNNCRYLGNYDVVDPRINMWNLYMVVSGCDTQQVRDSNGNNLGVTYNLNGTYTGLATLEEQFSIVNHPHDHFNFMTFGMVDVTGTKTINNRLTMQFFGH